MLMFCVYLYLYSKNNMKVLLASSFPVTEQLRNYGKSVWSITRFSGMALTAVVLKDTFFVHIYYSPPAVEIVFSVGLPFCLAQVRGSQGN